ncbi:MAG: metal ABC transporter permease, partial [Acidimicrobiales bacterium]
PGIGPVVAVSAVLAVGLIALVGRPLLLAALSPDVAASKGVPLRAVGLAYAAALALSAGLASLAVGAILATALLVGPAAAALRFCRRLGWSLVVSVALGIGSTWLGILLAYDSYYWGSGHQGFPVSFFVVSAVLAAYLLSGIAVRRGG